MSQCSLVELYEFLPCYRIRLIHQKRQRLPMHMVKHLSLGGHLDLAALALAPSSYKKF